VNWYKFIALSGYGFIVAPSTGHEGVPVLYYGQHLCREPFALHFLSVHGQFIGQLFGSVIEVGTQTRNFTAQSFTFFFF
jgi:hypothetical protein